MVTLSFVRKEIIVEISTLKGSRELPAMDETEGSGPCSTRFRIKSTIFQISIVLFTFKVAENHLFYLTLGFTKGEADLID